MKIAVLGAGGVGGYYGGRLAEAGEEVTFIARGANLAALRERGLRVQSTHGDFARPHVNATDKPASVGHVDLVIVSVKTYATDEAVGSLRGLVGPDTTVVSLQNGVDAAERCGAVVGMERMLGGVTYISAELAAPGQVRHVSPFARVVLGEVNRQSSPRLRRVVDALKDAHIQVEVSDDIERDIWTKFMFIAVQGSLTAITRLPIGPLRDTPATLALLTDALREIGAVARAKGVRLPEGIVEERLAFMQGLPAEMKSSMLGDVENGRRLENEAFAGAVVRLGEQYGIPTPVNRVLYGLLSAVDGQVARA